MLEEVVSAFLEEPVLEEGSLVSGCPPDPLVVQEGDLVVLVTYNVVMASSHGVIYSGAPELSPSRDF